MTPHQGEAIATARTFLRASNALRVVLILEPATMIDVAPGEDIELTEDDVLTTFPIDVPIPQAPKPLPAIRSTPASAISIDTITGELSAPIGTIDHLAESVLALASAFGGLSVASVEFATSDPNMPITLAARQGERVVLGAGDAQFEL
jgi:hypothetical protein